MVPGCLDGMRSFASTSKGCLSNPLPPGSFDMLLLCGLKEHLISFISLLLQSSFLSSKYMKGAYLSVNT